MAAQIDLERSRLPRIQKMKITETKYAFFYGPSDKEHGYLLTCGSREIAL